MLYSYGRFLLPHLPRDRGESSKSATMCRCNIIGWSASSPEPSWSRKAKPQWVKSPTEVGTGKAKDEEIPLSEIIQVLNERFGTEFNEEDRLFFQQIKEKACNDNQVIQTALANPLDKFELGIRKLIEDS